MHGTLLKLGSLFALAREYKNVYTTLSWARAPLSFKTNPVVVAGRGGVDSIAVSVFGWAKQIQYKSSPNRVSVSDGKIQITILILIRGDLSREGWWC